MVGVVRLCHIATIPMFGKIDIPYQIVPPVAGRQPPIGETLPRTAVVNRGTAMAFNPFEAFSVRSKLGKSVMAVLGIVVMLTFVLSSGGSSSTDFFGQIGGWFGGKGSGEVVAVAYGDKIREQDLSEINRQRRAANTYLSGALATYQMEIAKDLERDLAGTKLTADTKRDIERFVAVKVNSEKDPGAYVAFLRGLMDFQRFSPDAQKLIQAMSRVRSKPDSEDKKALDKISGIILHDIGLSPLILVDLGLSDRDLLDFAVLLKKADQLGINFSKEGLQIFVEKSETERMS